LCILFLSLPTTCSMKVQGAYCNIFFMLFWYFGWADMNNQRWVVFSSNLRSCQFYWIVLYFLFCNRNKLYDCLTLILYICKNADFMPIGVAVHSKISVGCGDHMNSIYWI
jgi:hypothetical protein